MKIELPVLPFLLSILMVLSADFIFIVLSHAAWPLVVTATLYFIYNSYRDIWHNGSPLVLYPRRK